MARRLKRRPNNTGSIIKLNGNRSKPFGVKITVGYKNENGRQLQPVVATFQDEPTAQKALDILNLLKDGILTHEQANSQRPDIYKVLMKNKHIQQITNTQVTMISTESPVSEKDIPTIKEIFYILFDEQYNKLADGGASYRSFFNHLLDIHSKQIHTVTYDNMQNILDDLKKVYGSMTLVKVKIILSDIFKYAEIHDYIEPKKNKTRHLNTKTNKDQTKLDIQKLGRPKKNTLPFTIEEIKKIAEYNTFESKFLLVLIFTGMRPKCLITAESENVHLKVNSKDNGSDAIVSYLITGSKTDAGRKRIIPVHPYIEPIIKEWQSSKNKYLVYAGKNLEEHKEYFKIYQSISNAVKSFLKSAGMGNHVLYDSRHTFMTFAEVYNMNPKAVKRIVGHKFKDITGDVYTHTIINTLYKEILKYNIMR